MNARRKKKTEGVRENVKSKYKENVEKEERKKYEKKNKNQFNLFFIDHKYFFLVKR